MRFNIQDPDTKMVFDARVRWQYESKRRPVSKKMRQTTRAIIDLRPAGVIVSATGGHRKWAWTENVWVGEAHVHPLDVKEKRFNRVDGQRQALERAIAGHVEPVREVVMAAFRAMRRAADDASRAAQIKKIKDALGTVAEADRAAYAAAKPAPGETTAGMTGEKVNLLEALANAVADTSPNPDPNFVPEAKLPAVEPLLRPKAATVWPVTQGPADLPDGRHIDAGEDDVL